MLNNLEKQTSIPKVYAILGLAGVYFFLIFFNIAGEFLVNFAGFLIPGYYSLEALFSSSSTDDTQWLTVSDQYQKSRYHAYDIDLTVLGRVCFLDRLREPC